MLAPAVSCASSSFDCAINQIGAGVQDPEEAEEERQWKGAGAEGMEGLEQAQQGPGAEQPAHAAGNAGAP